MNDTLNEQTETVASAKMGEDPAACENAGAGAAEVSLGKFRDVNALLNAYNSLQAEFTKRCQRVKELEAAAAVADKETVKVSPTENTGITPQEKETLIRDYLKEILGAKSKAIVLDGSGTGVKTPVKKPRTVEEAGKLAKEMLAK